MLPRVIADAHSGVLMALEALSAAANSTASSPPSDAALEASLYTHYLVALVVLAVFTLVLLLLDHKCMLQCKPLSPTGWNARFLLPYAACAAADWLQGPYVYALYASYDYSPATIRLLFIMGFTAAMVTGPFTGALADRFGLKRMILLGYCLVYSLACVTKHFRNLPILYLGRFFGGTATSVLFSCFEAWLVAEYAALGMSPATVAVAFSRMYFVNGLMGILMGPLAQVAVDAHPELQQISGALYVFGDITPFDLSSGFLLVGALLVGFMWSEYYKTDAPPADAEGGASKGEAPSEPAATGLRPALEWLVCQPLALLLMVASACTEAAMYSFVIEWTPTLTTPLTSPPHGLIFSAFMVAYMCGSTLVQYFATGESATGAVLLTLICAVGVLAAALITALLAAFDGHASLGATFAMFIAMCAFEMCLGAYFAVVGSVKAKEIPERFRAAVYGTFRIPLNIIVVVIEVLSPSSAWCFGTCAVLLLLASVCFGLVHVGLRTRHTTATSDGKTEAAPLVGR